MSNGHWGDITVQYPADNADARVKCIPGNTGYICAKGTTTVNAVKVYARLYPNEHRQETDVPYKPNFADSNLYSVPINPPGKAWQIDQITNVLASMNSHTALDTLVVWADLENPCYARAIVHFYGLKDSTYTDCTAPPRSDR